ncbi:MAG: hypothetical protein Q7J82_03560 [Coriobacteriia bacterium]|nr:hypothetical protein [Coriobacteriia bacterium]
MKRTIVAVLTAAVLIISLLPAVAAADSGTVNVSVHVGERIVLTPTADGVTVQANIPWQLVVDTTEGALTVTGEPTSGYRVELPETATAYWVVTD